MFKHAPWSVRCILWYLPLGFFESHAIIHVQHVFLNYKCWTLGSKTDKNYIHPNMLPLLKEKNKGGVEEGQFSSYLVKGVGCICGRFLHFFGLSHPSPCNYAYLYA